MGLCGSVIYLKINLVESIKQQGKFERVKSEERKLVKDLEYLYGKESSRALNRKKIYVKTLLRLK